MVWQGTKASLGWFHNWVFSSEVCHDLIFLLAVGLKPKETFQVTFFDFLSMLYVVLVYNITCSISLSVWAQSEELIRLRRGLQSSLSSQKKKKTKQKHLAWRNKYKFRSTLHSFFPVHYFTSRHQFSFKYKTL